MVRKTKCVTVTANGKTSVISASGKKLGDVLWVNDRLRMASLKKILAAWEALPEEERKPGLKVDYGLADPKRPLHRPPEGTLILMGQFRRFMANPDGSLRYTEQSDYQPGEGQNGWERLREPAQDTMWVPKSEWQALLPSSTEKGKSYAAPASFIARLTRYQLDPERGLGESVKFANVQPAAAQLTVTVEEVSEKELYLKLQGRLELAVKDPGPNGKVIAYSPDILGYLTYDRTKQEVSSFDLLAFGEANNSPRGLIVGKYYLGISYEFVKQPTEAQLVWPRGARDDLKQYLEPKPLVLLSRN